MGLLVDGLGFDGFWWFWFYACDFDVVIRLVLIIWFGLLFICCDFVV